MLRDWRRYLLRRQDVLTRRASEADAIVKERLLDADDTIVTLTIPEVIAGYWRKADLYLYTCSTNGSPAKVSRDTVRLSPYWASLWVCGVFVFIAYLLSALALRNPNHTLSSLISSLNPVKVSVGPDGKPLRPGLCSRAKLTWTRCSPFHRLGIPTANSPVGFCTILRGPSIGPSALRRKLAQGRQHLA